MPAESDDRRESPGHPGRGRRRRRHGHGGLFTRMREATGTVYGDIGTSVLYTVMEILRETIRLKHGSGGSGNVEALIERGGPLVAAREAMGALSLVFWALLF